jgi:hypothetical protein
MSLAIVAAELIAIGQFQARNAPAAPGSEVAPALRQSESATVAWAVDPAHAGENLPPAGRSLFDFLMTDELDGKRTYNVPFPYTALIRRIQQKAGCAPQESCFKQVLIPLGRSLQRTAAAPEFFKFPRVVGAVDKEPTLNQEGEEPAAMLLKDRLYLGYQEKASLLEVISYNEAAGRFEFQIVKDYREGGAPQVFYANRAICTACHQNHAPIFSRQVWDETNANPGIARRLKEQGRAFYGIEMERGVDVPNAIDAAARRANLLSAYQRLWREGCGGDAAAAPACRAAALVAALQYQLTLEREFFRDERFLRDFDSAAAKSWGGHWPQGLHIPDFEIPNRDPLQFADAVSRSHVPAEFEPLNPRAQLEVWKLDTDRYRLIRGIGDFIAAADLRRLDRHLFEQAAQRGAASKLLRASCTVTVSDVKDNARRFRFHCGDPGGMHQALSMSGSLQIDTRGRVEGTIESLSLSEIGQAGEFEIAADKALADADGHWSVSVSPMRNGVHVRTPPGHALQKLTLRWRGEKESTGETEAELIDDFAPVRGAIDKLLTKTQAGASDVFTNTPFRRAPVMAALFADLGIPRRDWCCLDDSGMPQARTDEGLGRAEEIVAARNASEDIQPFYRHCARCHDSNERFPPNFLHGDVRAVEANLKQCAPRIYFRLSMWQADAAKRAKSPMPPALAVGAAVAQQRWAAGEDFARLKSYAQKLFSAEGGAVPAAKEVLEKPYEELRSCLPG